MLGKWVEKLFGNKHDRDVNRLVPLANEINRIYFTLKNKSDDELKQKTAEYKKSLDERVGGIKSEIALLKEKLKDPNPAEPFNADDLRQDIKDLETNEFEETDKYLNDILPEAYAVIKEVCARLVGKKWEVAGNEHTWNMIPFDVQLMGSIILHEGKIAELATGEGKTLVAAFPLYLNALVGKGAHLVTVNDYLAQRDCEWMGEIFKFMGLTVAAITHDMTPEMRKEAYKADITYGTNNEFGFDYLRDNMSVHMEGVVQREHYYVIIDEVDSVLIDEARTPLIISGPVGDSKNRFGEVKENVERLVKNQTVLVNKLVSEAEKLIKEESEYDAGIKLLQAFRGSPKNPRLTKIMRESGIQKLIRRVESDFMRDKKLHEVDEDLYFAIEEKNNTIDLTDKGRQALAPNNPEMFILPDLATSLSEIEGNETIPQNEKIEKTEKLQQEYAEKSEQLHNISQLLKAYSLFEKDVEYVVADGKVMIVDEFTGRLMPGRRFSDGLHQALEAKENVKIERETQTLATITIQNFFRLYTKLAGMTGTAVSEENEFWEIYKLDVVVVPTNEPVRRLDHDDLIYRTKREKYNAIIDEIEDLYLRKLPVLVGTVSVEVSETLSRMLRRRNIRHAVLNAKYHQKEAEIVSGAGEPGMVTIATNMAGRGTDIQLGAGVIRIDDDGLRDLVKDVSLEASHKKRVLIHEIMTDDVQRLVRALEEAGLSSAMITSAEERQKLLTAEGIEAANGIVIIPKIYGSLIDAKQQWDGVSHIKVRDYSTGGLYIVGTERHEARRIDRQLRGRSGRQGDPGASRFYLSLEDDLMRLFAPDRIIGIMDKLGVEDGEVISHPLVTRSIERAQKRVENRNFEIRKHLLEYDDVMNKQREVIYSRRRRALEGENLHDDIIEMAEDFIFDSVEMCAQRDHAEDWDWEALSERLLKILLLPLHLSESEKEHINQETLIEKLQTAMREGYEKKRQFLGDELIGQLERFATLKTIDEKWKEHLYEMDRMKEGIGLRAYGQKDPLMEYKQEGFRIFTEMLNTINEAIVEICFKARIQVDGHDRLQARRRQPVEMAMVHEESSGMGFASTQLSGRDAAPGRAGKQAPVRTEHKVGRNEPCHCGSGKKFKHCHGRSQ